MTIKSTLRRMALGLSVLGLAALLLALCLVVSGDVSLAQVRPNTVPTEVSAFPIYDSQAISQALAYIATKQLDNGSIEGWMPGTADEFTTIKTVIALAAARRSVSVLTSASGNTPLDFLAGRAITYTHDATGILLPGRAGMLAVAVVAGDGDAYDFGGMNLIHELTGTYHTATGAYSTTAKAGFSSGAAGAINQLWTILGLAAAQETVPAGATDFLLGLQEPDGGWGWGAGIGDVDTTALVVQALLASGNLEPTHPKVQEGLDFLRANQADWGGWEAWGSPSADSTAAAIQAIVAAGYTPATESWASSPNPQTALAGLQAPDGSFSGNALGTAHAIAGLAEAPLPIWGRMQRARLALTWMNEQQQASGSWPGFGGAEGATCDAVLAYAAAGYDPATVRASGSPTSAIEYLASRAAAYAADGPDRAGKLIVTVVAAGQDPYTFGGVDLVHVLTATHYSPTLGAFGVPTNTWHQAFAILGLAAAGETVPVSDTKTLLDLQQADGGWKYDLSDSPWNTTTPDSTGLAMQALIAAGVSPTDTALLGALNFLKAQQDARGGWGNANSTAYAIQGLLAAGQDLIAGWSVAGHSPYDALAIYQKPDGPFVWTWSWPEDNGLATWQAVPALLGRAMPIYPPLALPVGQNLAGLVVDYGNGSIDMACIAFPEDQISGLDLLDRSGIPYEYGGGFVTKIGDVGCPAADPWCAAPYYWSYWGWEPITSTWQFAMIGPAGSTVTDGEIEGWRWEDWNLWPAPTPGLTPTLEVICGVPDLIPFAPVHRGPDADRLVAAMPRALWNNSLDVIIPFGSDLNGDGTVVLDYRVLGETTWIPGTALSRGDGYFMATVPATQVASYELRATFADLEQVQYDVYLSDTIELTTIFRAYTIYLPLIAKD
ncbi:MAG: hypothetical protein ACUVWZ_09950 [Anaerolineae bacterium]